MVGPALVNTLTARPVYDSAEFSLVALENADGDQLMARLFSRGSSEDIRATSADARLVEAARQGDQSAFGRLYEQYAGLVHGILLARVQREEADDLVQDVFMIALRRISALRDPNSFGAWLSAIARNLANDHYRRLKPTDPLTEDRPETACQTVTGYPSAGTAEGILDVIRSLPNAYSETLILRLVEGMTGPEIAIRTGLTHGSVRVNLCRGMRMLRDRLEPLGSSRSERDIR
jgi:RNA polymerase sigma-70 factor (ECF subfamily)